MTKAEALRTRMAPPLPACWPVLLDAVLIELCDIVADLETRIEAAERSQRQAVIDAALHPSQN